MKFINKVIFAFFLLLTCLSVNSLEYYSNDFGYSVNLPVGWRVFDNENSSIISFVNQDDNAVFQVFVFKNDAFSDSGKILDYIKSMLNAQGESESFNFYGNDSVLADLTYKNRVSTVRGYFLCINSGSYDFAVLSFSDTNFYEKNLDTLLSALDSFSIDNNHKLKPGPISQYFYPFPGKNRTPGTITIKDHSIKISVDKMEIDSAQVLINRESRILTQYQNKADRIQAWERYYKIIYRDNFDRITEFTSKFNNEIRIKQSLTNEKTIKLLVNWIQDYEYQRTDDISDFISPVNSLLSRTGDCDSRALLLNIILHQLNIDCVLLVSEVYKHSACGISMNSTGAGFTFNNKKYIYAELTQKVDIGLISQQMSNIDNWQIFDLKK